MSLESFEHQKSMVDSLQKKKTTVPAYLAHTSTIQSSAHAPEAGRLWKPEQHQLNATARLHITYNKDMVPPTLKTPPDAPVPQPRKQPGQSSMKSYAPRTATEIAGNPDWKCTHNYYPQYHTQFYDKLP